MPDADVLHKYLKLDEFTLLCASVAVTVVVLLCAQALFPFIPNVIVGATLSITFTVLVAVPVFPDESVTL
ncbi:hypothetical protein D3C80_2208880 [compost metagenome]